MKTIKEREDENKKRRESFLNYLREVKKEGNEIKILIQYEMLLRIGDEKACSILKCPDEYTNYRKMY